MPTSAKIVAVILFLLTLVSFWISYLQFKEKGILLNNAFLYASKEERKSMNKQPHYRQSSIVFTGIGLIFLLIFIEIMTQSDWIFFAVIGLAILLIIYAIGSTVVINKK